MAGGPIKSEYLALSRKSRAEIAAHHAARMLRASFKDRYDTVDMILEPLSYHEDDWYLWILAARDKDAEDGRYGVWTMNLSTLSLNEGHYGVPARGLNAVIRGKEYKD